VDINLNEVNPNLFGYDLPGGEFKLDNYDFAIK
jgi:hypothetical protein